MTYSVCAFTSGFWVLENDRELCVFTRPTGGVCNPAQLPALLARQEADAYAVVRKLNAHDALLAACKKYLAWKDDKRAPIWDGAKVVEDIRAAVALAEPTSLDRDLPPQES